MKETYIGNFKRTFVGQHPNDKRNYFQLPPPPGGGEKAVVELIG